MNLDQLKENWQTQMEQSTAGSKLASSESAMQRAKQFERSIWLRDLIESLAAVLVIATFMLFLLFGKAPWLMQVGAGVIIAGAALILIVMNTTRRCDRRNWTHHWLSSLRMNSNGSIARSGCCVTSRGGIRAQFY